MKIGYARVSTDDQTLDLQRDALNAAGCERLFEDKASGAKADRPGLAEALAFTRKGDALVVWRLDRLGRSLPELVRLVGELDAAGIGFESLTEKIDGTTAAGRLVFHVFAALAEFERNLIRERTNAGRPLPVPVVERVVGASYRQKSKPLSAPCRPSPRPRSARLSASVDQRSTNTPRRSKNNAYLVIKTH